MITDMGIRIIGGRYKGKKLISLEGKSVRPTSGIVRESIFNILSNHVIGAVVLDLFAGTGALGIEAISRGANHAVFIDRNPKALVTILKNVQASKINEKVEIIQWDILKSLDCLRSRHLRFNLIFLDPPYHQGMVEPSLINLEKSESLEENCIMVIEHGLKELIPDLRNIRISDQRKYGKTLVSFLKYVVRN
jgi:16S rRNA (guanine966-N2)-methyltransferase